MSAKRAVDLVFGGALFLITLPILVIGAVLVLLETGRPVFFPQQRAGRHGRPIIVLKLRTMYRDIPPPEALGQVRDEHSLVTPVGRWLRRLKVDELSQLINVIGGSMSLVGPRPTLLSQAADYTPEERERLAVNPGLTGWAQVNGNTGLTWPERIMLDRWYVRHRTVLLDMWIMLRTIEVVIRGERIHVRALARARAEGL